MHNSEPCDAIHRLRDVPSPGGQSQAGHRSPGMNATLTLKQLAPAAHLGVVHLLVVCGRGDRSRRWALAGSVVSRAVWVGLARGE